MKKIDMNIFKEDILNTIRESLLVLDSDLNIVYCNNSFYDTFRVTPGETKDMPIYRIGNGQWNIPQLRELLEKILPDKSSIANFSV